MRTYLLALTISISTATSVLSGEYDIILKSYGEMVLVAGTGQLGDVNGWQPGMEGTNALHAELSNTHMTMADAQGNLYLADKLSHSILKITPDGTIHTVVGTHIAGSGSDESQPGTSVALNEPNGLYVLPNGTVYILDKENGIIRKLGPDGNVVTVVPDTLNLGAGRGLWVSPDESVIFYTASSVVRKWTPADGVSTYASGFDNLANIDVDPTDGNLVVTDRGTHQVYRIFSDGSREVIAGNGTPVFGGDGGPATNAGIDSVRGIAFLPHGGYFLASQKDGEIWYVETNGMAHVFISGNGSSTPLPYDTVCEPRGISIAPWGDLIITENDYAVVRVVPRLLAVSDTELEVASGLNMTWYSMPSILYDIESTEDLIATNWQTVATVQGASGSIVTAYTETNAVTNRTGFIRVVRKPSGRRPSINVIDSHEIWDNTKEGKPNEKRNRNPAGRVGGNIRLLTR